MEDLSQFSHVPEVPASWTFELSGHAEKWLGDSPVIGMLGFDPNMPDCQYPDWVVPIGKLQEKECTGIYLQRSGIVRAHYFLDTPNIVKYDNTLKEKLSGYDFRRHRLFAFSRDDVIYHDDNQSEDLRVIKSVLSDARFNDTNPFLRLSIAYRSKDEGLVLPELRRCAKHLGNGDYLKAWYQAEIDSMKRPEERLGVGMPELARMLEQQGTLESLLTEN